MYKLVYTTNYQDFDTVQVEMLVMRLGGGGLGHLEVPFPHHMIDEHAGYWWNPCY